jgi:predicted secreted Zn-dependent protease
MNQQLPRSRRTEQHRGLPARLSRDDRPRGVQENAALALLRAVSQRERQAEGAAGQTVGVGNANILRSLARVLGNHRLAHLAHAEPTLQRSLEEYETPASAPDQTLLERDLVGHHDPDRSEAAAPMVTTLGSAELVQREAHDSALVVALSFNQTETQRYQVSGATMQEVDAELPANVGEFRHSVVQGWQTQPTEESGTRVTRVTLPVQYHYLMPQWTRLSEQPQRVQDAWNRFYGDVLVHEQEHLSVSRRYYNELKDTLQALPAEERTEERVQLEIDTSIENQNENHSSHAGFATPSSIVFSDYFPEPEPAPEAAEDESEGGPETAAE